MKTCSHARAHAHKSSPRHTVKCAGVSGFVISTAACKVQQMESVHQIELSVRWWLMAERPVPFLHVDSFRKGYKETKRKTAEEKGFCETKLICLEPVVHKCQKDISMIKAKPISKINNCNTEQDRDQLVTKRMLWGQWWQSYSLTNGTKNPKYGGNIRNEWAVF